MDELADIFWDWAPILVMLALGFAIAKWMILVFAGNDALKSQGWKAFQTVIVVLFVGIIVSLAFPQVREKAASIKDDPCQIIGISCR